MRHMLLLCLLLALGGCGEKPSDQLHEHFELLRSDMERLASEYNKTLDLLMACKREQVTDATGGAHTIAGITDETDPSKVCADETGWKERRWNTDTQQWECRPVPHVGAITQEEEPLSIEDPEGRCRDCTPEAYNTRCAYDPGTESLRCPGISFTSGRSHAVTTPAEAHERLLSSILDEVRSLKALMQERLPGPRQKTDAEHGVP